MNESEILSDITKPKVLLAYQVSSNSETVMWKLLLKSLGMTHSAHIPTTKASTYFAITDYQYELTITPTFFSIIDQYQDSKMLLWKELKH